MGSFSQRAAEILRGMQATMKAAAGQQPGSSGSSTGSNLTASSVGPSLLHYADLLGQYNSYSASQRRQLLEGLQMQLLPRVRVCVRLQCMPVHTCKHAHMCLVAGCISVDWLAGWLPRVRHLSHVLLTH